MTAPSASPNTGTATFDPTNFPRLRRKLIHFFHGREVRWPDGEECADETLFRVQRKAAAGEQIKSLDAYALGVAQNVLCEYRRGESKRGRSSAEESSESSSSSTSNDDSFPALLNALKFLSAQEQKILKGYYMTSDHITDRQKMARKAGITLNNLYVRVFRLRQKALEILKEQGHDSIERCKKTDFLSPSNE